MNKIVKFGLLATVTSVLLSGCFNEECLMNVSPEETKLDEFTSSLNLYATKKYTDSNKTCEDFKNKRLSLEELKESVSYSHITIEIENKNVSVKKEYKPFSIPKNALVDLLDNEANLKSNIDKYIVECK